MHSPHLSKIQKIIGVFDSGEQSYDDDVVDMKFGFKMQRRSLSSGEGKGG